ncbi:hypothetical protein LAHI110946_12535 [Lactococcus hircilactis]
MVIGSLHILFLLIIFVSNYLTLVQLAMNLKK